MSMKKSEYVEKRTGHWSIIWSYPINASAVKQQVQWDVEAVEAAGYAWEPEEPELPEEICWRLIAFMPTIRGLPKHGPSAPLTPVAAAEVVRRYNTWPELRHIAANLLEECDNAEGAPSALQRFLDILNGKEGTRS